MTVHLLIDCDPGIDDSLALAYAAAHPDVSIEAIIATGGNVSTEQVGRNIRGLLTLLDQDNIPWALGSLNPLAQDLTTTEETHGPLGTGHGILPHQTQPTGKPHDAGAQLWVDTANRHPGTLDAIVLGPSTNLARALELDPELPTKLASLHIMGGALNHRGNTMPTTEWNVHSDPEALHRVLHAYTRDDLTYSPVLCPLDATETIIMTPQRRDDLTSGRGAELYTFLDQALRFYMEFHEWDGLGYIAHVHDPYVTALAINRALTRTGQPALHLGDSTPVTLDVELTGTLTRGQVVADWLGRWGKKPQAQALTHTEVETFFTHYTQILHHRYP